MKTLLFISISLLVLSGLYCSDDITRDSSPDQFVKIYFKHSFANELNTFDKTYQKDLVAEGTIKVSFWLSEEEQNRILKKASDISFFEMPGVFPREEGIMIAPDPGEQVLRIEYRRSDNTVTWFVTSENNQQLEAVRELAAFINNIIYSKPEYKRLPSARGGYL